MALALAAEPVRAARVVQAAVAAAAARAAVAAVAVAAAAGAVAVVVAVVVAAVADRASQCDGSSLEHAMTSNDGRVVAGRVASLAAPAPTSIGAAGAPVWPVGAISMPSRVRARLDRCASRGRLSEDACAAAAGGAKAAARRTMTVRKKTEWTSGGATPAGILSINP